ncbi:cysteine--tRNA ligase [Acinetobacter baylyi]|uniref:Cysteine--tRNA ligase n=1 Tax=Acinetobacter baylyi (strain ATCC 33305 / BD413 / ADP1) TaxID=62977 RepID=SYC_ACIAD|nr:cysteine--tRNA ligase [Acinetobacter baylyi]Q6FC71.1 RecName: Full=Cysteine--tRNA ligase; AltName: Full=Cysteinyl-tRNA synthetase; Short=CysRS [Acinetobacter baylyi ADP1]ENV54514.1 cysteinyl-tRNA synthetase [Acinetobacter baylyi DSM 14961 = CIP 107474]KAF2372670.1 cysteine--tRNA ligase [Acinetobacter baylyi]KAF2374161.1 cysteine--tRNA ligase [Acinetobacter baylyi]KAF2377926.1 cysteine--tRNA ligase [Acinetobacter baylyi]KAF2380389.1 cysteine--tRNA ligase [Acinetobacter baylyi]
MQPFVLYNSEQRKKVEFVPRKPGHIDMYVCGMTVYDYCHIGHARVMVAFDYIIRFLRSQGWDVRYIRNITDIDDKIIKRANENNETIQQLTSRFIDAMNEDAAKLGCAEPDEAPKATEYIGEMQNMISTLVDKGSAYPASNGDVYFEVSKFEKYGRLSGRKLEDMQAGASERVDIEVEKKHPFDFVLWKGAKPNEPSWVSPWGNGRPGWHIECSAMSTCCLGNHFDIHGGGSDLTFPHHENEIAQSEASTGEQYVNYWMHVGFINVDGEKMSKSLGNFFTIRDVMEKFHPEVIRYFIVSSHYRSPVNFSDVALKEAKTALTRFYHAFKAYEQVYGQNDSTQKDEQFIERFNIAMRDDFNTPEAIAVLFELNRELNRAVKEQQAEQAAIYYVTLRHLTQILGLVQHDVDEFLKSDIGQEVLSLSDDEIQAMIQQRADAKKAKDFSGADAIRQALLDQGVVLEDTRQGTLWRRAD